MPRFRRRLGFRLAFDGCARDDGARKNIQRKRNPVGAQALGLAPAVSRAGQVLEFGAGQEHGYFLPSVTSVSHASQKRVTLRRQAMPR